MSDEPGYSAVRRGAGGRVEVALGADHPGVADPAYRARRDAIAALSVDHVPGEPIPEVLYTAEEAATWRTVVTALRPLWRASATRSFLDGVEALDLPVDHVPQLAEVSARLRPLTGFTYEPVAGLAPLRRFYSSFGDGAFSSTQYLRHGSSPLYTPEPDLCHEVLGHAHQLADARVASVYRQVAQAVRRLETEEALRFLSRVFWFTVEFGVVREDGDLKAFGAGLLSSSGELRSYRTAEVHDLDWVVMGTASYDISRYQPVLHVAASVGELCDRFGELLASFDDDVAARATAGSSAR